MSIIGDCSVTEVLVFPRQSCNGRLVNDTHNR